MKKLMVWVTAVLLLINMLPSPAAADAVTAVTAANDKTVAGAAANDKTVAGAAAKDKTVAGAAAKDKTVAGAAANDKTVAGAAANDKTVAVTAANDKAVTGPAADYEDYCRRVEGIGKRSEIEAAGFRVIEEQVFPVWLESFGDVFFVPALDNHYRWLVLFLTDENGQVLYKTDQLETNYGNPERMRQPTRAIAAVSFQDLNRDGLTDIGLITSCVNEEGDYAGKTYKTGDVLFQAGSSFYRDYRISEKINRFGMNTSIQTIVAFVRDGYSTEFLYTATTLDELLAHGLVIIEEQRYVRQFEKLGRLDVIPGKYTMANCEILMIYLVNDQGSIVWSLQTMGEYENLYALKGMAWRDIDGDGVRDITVLARYSREGLNGERVIENDYAIFYQRTGGFAVDTEFKNQYRCTDDETMTKLLQKAREYWGWSV